MFQPCRCSPTKQVFLTSDILLCMKNILLYILLFVLLLLVVFLYLDRYFISRKQTTSLPKKVINTLKKVMPSPRIQITPGYSVSIVKAPYLDDFYGNFNFEVNVKNISVSPFITKIAFGWLGGGKCKFSDSKGNKYTGDINDSGGGVRFNFPKGLLPGEDYTFEKKLVGVSLDGGGNINSGDTIRNINTKPTNIPTRCHYDSKGNNVCVPIEGLKFIECAANISTNDDGSSKFPLVVNFPQ